MGQTTLDEARASVESRLERDMKALLPKSSWSRAQKLALGCRILAQEGHGLSLAGQVTARAEASDEFWTTSFGYGLADTTASNIVLMDSNLVVRQGEGMPNPGVRFHMWIYRTKPEVNCIVHTHAPHAAALSMLGRRLMVSHMDTCMFYEDCAYLPHWPGVPLANEEGEIISAALGTDKSILLAHHGLLTTGRTIEEAVYLAVSFEHAARLQLSAAAVGEIQPLDRQHALKAREFLLGAALVESTFNYWARRIIGLHPQVVVAP